MADQTEALRIAGQRNARAQAYLLREVFENLRHSPHQVDLCEWIASCFFQLDDFAQAGTWYETAGQIILAETSSPEPVKALSAVGEYEKALECYEQGADIDAITECSTMLHQLRRACASA